MWTALENYLHRRLSLRIMTNEDSMKLFLEKSDFEDIQHYYGRKNKGKLTPIYFILNQKKVVEGYLDSFQYHDLPGTVNKVYNNCFRFSLSEYPRFKEINQAIQLRHEIVHKGLFNLESAFEYRDVMNFGDLILDFAEWLESKIRESDRNREERVH